MNKLHKSIVTTQVARSHDEEYAPTEEGRLRDELDTCIEAARELEEILARTNEILTNQARTLVLIAEAVGINPAHPRMLELIVDEVRSLMAHWEKTYQPTGGVEPA